ncbi:MAG: FAD-binding protein [Alphaproteobacteria bacterium]|nr:FAD-binding protein [Alphaproteobacteria bacterium]
MANAWSNWAGNLSCAPRTIVVPPDREAAIAAVRTALRDGAPIRVSGAAHSFSPIVPSDGTLLLLDRLAGVLDVDSAAGTARLAAGTRIHALGDPLRGHGLALANQGDIDQQAIAGAIATGTHGTGPSLGSLSTMVAAVELIDGRGQLVVLDASRPRELSCAALSVGALGVMLSVTLRLRPAYRLHERVWIEPIDSVLARLDERIAATRHFEFFWRPASDDCECKALQPTEAPIGVPPDRDGERVDHSARIFPSVRLHKFVESEWSVPAARGPDCFRELRALMRSRHRDVTMPIEYRTVAADDLPLSPNHGRASVTLSIHDFPQRPWQAFFADAQAIFRNHAGRPHWGKWHGLVARDLAELYPAFATFGEVRRAFDPGDAFVTPQLRALFEP